MSDIISRNQKITKIACNTCAHFHLENMDGYSCAAFIEIPENILSGDNMHFKPIKDQDNDIVYLQLKE